MLRSKNNNNQGHTQIDLWENVYLAPKKRINKYINTMDSLKIDEIVVDLSWNLLSY